MNYKVIDKETYYRNATENSYSRQNIENFIQKIMKTESGKRILKTIFAH